MADLDRTQHAENERLYAAFLAGVAAREAQDHCATLGVHHQIESYFEDFLEGSAVPPPKPSDHGEPADDAHDAARHLRSAHPPSVPRMSDGSASGNMEE